MSGKLLSQVLKVKEKFEQNRDDSRVLRDQMMDQVKQLIEHSSLFADAWVGNWGEGFNHYRKDFDLSSRLVFAATENIIKNYLTASSGVDINRLHNEVVPISQKFFRLQEFVLDELSFIKDDGEYKTESEILDQIKNFKWGMAPGTYIDMHKPKSIVVYDPEILNRGIQVPPHLAVGEDIIGIFTLLAAYDNFEKLLHRLVRSIELKTTSDSPAQFGSLFLDQALKATLETFHAVSTQLKNRYSGRQTLVIEDEYDVQDLMHALLKIHFEDVRKEEDTPSYAGGSSRIDFLLKREKTVLEVKKTRTTLKDREVGSQLIIDIARYKSHPDCKRLICFVYDPDSFIANPRGLEDDLNKLSSEEMNVEVFIRP